jgi:hypothetical protein
MKMKFSTFLTLCILVLVNLLGFVAIGTMWVETQSAVLGLILITGFILFQKHLYNTRPRKIITVLWALERVSAADFNPARYFRVVKSLSWRRLELQVDDAVYIPDAEIVAVMAITGPDVETHLLSCPVLFEYRGVLYHGYYDTEFYR